MSDTATQAQILDNLNDLFTRDGLENLMANLGTSQDKRAYSSFTNGKRLSGYQSGGVCDELNELYQCNWVAGKVIDIIPNDMTREWRSFNGDNTDYNEALEELDTDFNLSGMFNDAHKWARLYGTSVIIMAVDDGQEPEMKLDVDNLKPGCIRHFKVLDRNMIHQSQETYVTEDALDPNYGLPEFYSLNNSNQKIHNSRILRFDGVKLPQYLLQYNGYMSDSVLDRLYDPLVDLFTATTGGASMIYNMNVDVFSVEGLMELLQSPNGEALVKKRFSLMGLMKSFQNMIVKDTKETFETKTHSFSGLPQLLDLYLRIISAGTDIPTTRMLGSAPGGLNATGESDLRNYYDMLRSRQKNEYGPLLRYLDPILKAHLGITKEYKCKTLWNPLRQESAAEKAETQSKNASRDAIYLQEGVVDEVTVAKELKNDSVYTQMSDDLFNEGNNVERQRIEREVNNFREQPLTESSRNNLLDSLSKYFSS